MSDYNNPVKVLQRLYGCDFSDMESVNTLADADWLTRRLTVLYRDSIMTRLLNRFHKVPTFAVTLDTAEDEVSGEVKKARLMLCGLYCGDRLLEGDPEEYALGVLKELTGLDSLCADTPRGIRRIMEAIAHDIPEIRKYYDF